MNERTLVKFEKNKTFLSGTSSAGIQLGADTDPQVLLALKNDSPFPERQIELGKIAINAEGGKDIEFGKGSKKVTFKGGANASAFSGLGVYQDANSLIGSLGLDDNIAPALDLQDSADSLYLLLRWGYDLEASTSGAVALGGPGLVKFGADGKREAMFAVMRRLPKSTGALTAVKKTLNSWRLPSQVDSIKDFEPGTWLISEVDSAIALTLGAQFGYNFNWVKEAKLKGLSGDIGLQLQLGVTAALGFQASGKFALLIGRDASDEQTQELRLRLFKQRKKGWNFALNTRASVQADFDSFLPDNFNDLVKAVFGTHGAQILKDLEVIEKWTNPNQDISELLGGISVDYFKKFVADVTGVDPETAFDEAKGRLQSFLEKWNQLDHKAATTLWKLVEENVDLSDIRNIVNIITESDEQSIKRHLEDKIADVDFFKTPAGKFLLSLIPLDSLLSVLTDSQAFEKFQEVAQKASEVLDGELMEETLIKLQDNLNQRLKLDKIENVVSETDFKDLDEWLKAKLSDFLGETLNLSKLDDIRKTIHLLFEKRQEFYDKTLKALTRQYEFKLSAAYQKTTTNQALIDVVFDFGKGDVSKHLKQAIGGKFDKLMAESHSGIRLKAATLTHEINRQSSVELSLPFFKSSVKHINNSLAKVNAVDEDDGRVLVYELGAKDIVLRKNQQVSTLAVGGFLKVNANQVRIHSTDALTYSYSFRQAKRNMKRADVQYQLKPYVKAYFPSSFSAMHDGAISAPFDTWVGDLDKTIDQLESNGTDNFGHTLISLQVSLSSEIASAWLQAPSDKKAIQYMNMSRRLQAKLKQLLPFYYFQNVENYENIVPASVLLAYAAVPPSTTIQTSFNALKKISTDRDVYWNWPDRNQQEAMLNNNLTAARLARLLEQVHNRVEATPGMEGKAKFYDPERVAGFLSDVINGNTEMHFRSLFLVESEIVHGAHDAGLKLAKFAKKASSEPSEAVKVLADFGANITETFNKSVRSIYGGDAVRPLGTMMFAEAAFALNPQVSLSDANAMLDLIILKQTTDFNFARYVEGRDVPTGDVLLQERLVELAS
ncbi:hypothetical protein GWO43_31090 [candidate division KSB1 bacterium]|nr:hypothetical protein [candidate division KSB1 bacterium]NIR73187.1 hypothetical protein [candidate division KSB1 bacterium]NIS28336.1 hypothetical protein [candidate division KSB1 bacterium]NIT75228.1 hypothetical protein [candidate division KSB1 bacterium]NIU29068.1 hypothetical protein [candidate division KSB1 bacterium]